MQKYKLLTYINGAVKGYVFNYPVKDIGRCEKEGEEKCNELANLIGIDNKLFFEKIEELKLNKIDKIYKVISNKELSFGCRIKDENGKEYIFWKMCESGGSFDTIGIDGKIDRFYYPMSNNKNKGYPVMYGDIIYRIENNLLEINEGAGCYEGTKNYDIIESNEKIAITIEHLYKDKREPIEYQSEECKKFIYNLIKDKGCE